MASLESKILDAHEKQMRQFLDEYSKMARVTLLEPYPHNNGIVTMRYGASEAQVMGEGGDDPDVIDLTRRPRRIIPGTPNHYHLSWEEMEMRCECEREPFTINKTIVMPLVAAEVWFGHWQRFTKILAAGEVPDPESSSAWQKKKVAQQWGGYTHRRTQTGENYRGLYAKLERISPPPVPNVEIVRLDSQMKKIPNSAFRPLEIYKFDADCVPDQWNSGYDTNLVAYTKADMEKAIAEAVAKEMLKLQAPKKAAV